MGLLSAADGSSAKALSLVTLTVQNSLLVLLLRYSRTVAADAAEGPAYSVATAVLLCEAIKLVLSIALFARTGADRSVPFVPQLVREVFSPRWYLLGVPAVLYTVQNNLVYVAATVLDPATFQTTYQLKILTTALCSVWLLHRTLAAHKWAALLLLTTGVALVQLPTSSLTSSSASDNADSGSRAMGLLAVGVACLLSGLACVYFEKLLKQSKTSVWIRNAQMSLFSLVPALIGVLSVDGAQVREYGFFAGYTTWTWAVILCQAVYGLVVALVVKYADNILKGFATSISILLSAVASVYLFNFSLSPTFVAGATVVIHATFLYGQSNAPMSLMVPAFASPRKVHIRGPTGAISEDGSSSGTAASPLFQSHHTIDMPAMVEAKRA